MYSVRLFPRISETANVLIRLTQGRWRYSCHDFNAYF